MISVTILLSTDCSVCQSAVGWFDGTIATVSQSRWQRLRGSNVAATVSTGCRTQLVDSFTGLLNHVFLPARRYASTGNRHSNVSVRLSVRLSRATIVSKPSGSPNTLVLWRQISSPISKGFHPNGGLKQGWVGKIQRFSSFKRRYLENGSRYGQSYY